MRRGLGALYKDAGTLSERHDAALLLPLSALLVRSSLAGSMRRDL